MSGGRQRRRKKRETPASFASLFFFPFFPQLHRPPPQLSLSLSLIVVVVVAVVVVVVVVVVVCLSFFAASFLLPSSLFNLYWGRAWWMEESVWGELGEGTENPVFFSFFCLK